MTTKVGGAYIEIRADDKYLKSDLDKAHRQVESSTDKMQSQTSKAFSTMTAVAAASAAAIGYSLVKLTTASIAAASALEEVSSKYSVVFKGQTQVVDTWANNLVEKYAMSTRESKKYLSSVQDLLVPMGMQSKAAAVLSNEIVKLAADLGSFNDLPTEQVMLNIQSALTGEYESMKKYGVVLKATTVQQEALNMGLAGTKDALTAADRAQAAFKMIVEGSQAAIGDMERTARGYANTTKRLSAEWEDFTAVLGEKFLPTATKVKSVLADILDNMTKAIKGPTFEDIFGDVLKTSENVRKSIKTLQNLRSSGSIAIDKEREKVITRLNQQLVTLSDKETILRLAYTIEGVKNVSKLVDEVEKVNNKLDDTHKNLTEIEKELLESKIKKELENWFGEIEKIEDSTDRFKKSISEVVALIKDFELNQTPDESEYQKWLGIDRQTKKSVEDFYADWVKEHEDALKDQSKETVSFTKKEEDAYQHMYDNIHDIQADLWRDFMDGGENAFDIILDKAKDIFAEIMATWSTKLVMNAVGGVTGNLFDGSSGFDLGKLPGIGKLFQSSPDYASDFIGGDPTAFNWASLGQGAVIAGAAMVAQKVLSNFMADSKPRFGFSGNAREYGTMHALGTPDYAGYDKAVNVIPTFKSENFDYSVWSQYFDDDPAIRASLINYFDTVFTNLSDVMQGDINTILQDYKYEGIGSMDSSGNLAAVSKGVFDKLLGGLLLDIFPNAGSISQTTKTLTGSQGISTQFYTDNIPVYTDITHQTSALADIFTSEFFSAIMPEGSNEWDAFIKFGKTVKDTENFMDSFNTRINDLGLSSVDAYQQIEYVTTTLTNLADAVASIEIDPITAQIKTMVAGFGELNASLIDRNASLAEQQIAGANQEKLFWSSIVGMSGGASGIVNSMAGSVQKFTTSSDQQAMQKIASQGEQVNKFFGELYDTIVTDAPQFAAGAKVVKQGFEVITKTLIQAEALNMYSGHLSTIGGMKAGIFGLEKEWSTMGIGKKYGAQIGTAQEQAAFVKSILGMSANEFITYAESFGTSVSETAGDMMTLSDIVKETSDAFKSIKETVMSAKNSILDSSTTMDPAKRYKNAMAAFNLASSNAMSLDPVIAQKGAEDMAALSSKVLEYSKASTSSFYTYKATESQVLSALQKVGDYASEQVDILDSGDPGSQLTELEGISADMGALNVQVKDLLKGSDFTLFYNKFNEVFNDNQVFNTLNSTLISLTSVIGQTVPGSTSSNGSIASSANVISGLKSKYNPSVALDSSVVSWWESSSLFEKADLSNALGVSPSELKNDIGMLANSLGIPGYASGGFASGLSIVGENGPEIVNFNPGASVYSTTDSSGMMEKAMDPIVYQLKDVVKKLSVIEKKVMKWDKTSIPVRTDDNVDFTVVTA